MKKINAWLKKFFRIGKGDDVQAYTVRNGEIKGWTDRNLKGYATVFSSNALKEGATVIIDHNAKTVTFKI